MSKGFRKGKFPDRFKGWTAQTIEMTPSSYIANICDISIKEQNKLMEDKIVSHLNVYYDDELMAAQYVTKLQSLEKALDKACALLNGAITNEYHSINKECNLIETHVEPFMTIKEWKEWCMNNAD